MVKEVLRSFDVSIFLLGIVLLNQVGYVFILIDEVCYLFICDGKDIHSFKECAKFHVEGIEEVFNFSFIFMGNERVCKLALNEVIYVIMTLGSPVYFIF